MKIRKHRGSLSESMATVREIEPFRTAVRDFIREAFADTRLSKIEEDEIYITHYGWDSRVNWDTYIITESHFGVLGFTDGPCDE